MSLRVILPFAVAAVALVIASLWAGAVLAWILAFVAIAGIMDGATLLFSRGGGMSGYKQ